MEYDNNDITKIYNFSKFYQKEKNSFDLPLHMLHAQPGQKNKKCEQ